MNRVVVVGDLVTDVLVAHAGPIAHGSDTEASITMTGGGQAANTAAWLAHAGVPVTLIAAVGDDPAGAGLVADLTAAGVDCAVSVHPGVSTGSVVVLSGPSERTMITDRGASLLLSPSFVASAIPSDAVHLHLSGYPLLHSGSRAAGLAALAADLFTSVDAASAAPLRAVGGSSFLNWVRTADLLICNADEASVLAGNGTAAFQASSLTGFVRNIVVKRGSDGAVWAGPDGSTASWGGERVRVADPTGAGDAFAAGLIAAWRSSTPEAALAAACRLGATAVTKIGARP